MSYYNTTHESEPQLSLFRQAAIRQEDVILRHFRQHAGILYTPSQINGLLPQAPLTSIRRALSNLTADGFLVKTAIKREGPYGRNEHTWMYPIDRMRAA